MASGTPTEVLFEAVRRGEVDVVSRVIDERPALLSACDPHGETPVLTAVYHRRSAVLDALLARKTTLDVFEASAVGDVAAVRAALARDPDGIAARSGDGWTALHLAAHFGHAAVVDLLLDHGADVHARSSNAMRNQPLHAAAAGRAAATVVARLLARGATVDAAHEGGFTALHEAAFRGDLPLVRLLLANGADARLDTAEGETAATIAAKHGHTPLLQLLAALSERPQ